MSPSAIGQRLTLSVRTVENHVSSILGKLLLGSRTEIALWYTRH
ncbi:MAG TPA: LuxR C-terminal-related transcriptional regulator [Dermatophilaceae bacterium]|nr:LuxR C-terminal-related transcriptional regulator [Dermatophilaceae bacterium]